MNNRDTPEPIAHGIALVIDTYCDWAKSFDPDHPEWHIRPQSFLDPPYGYVAFNTDPYHTYDYTIWSLTVDNGDDGGAQGLTVWWGYDYDKGDALFDNNPDASTGEWLETFTDLCHMTQTFDTRMSIVVEDRKLHTDTGAPIT